MYTGSISVAAKSNLGELSKTISICTNNKEAHTINVGMDNWYLDAIKTLNINEDLDNMLDIKVILAGQDIDWYINDVFLSRTTTWGQSTGSDYHHTKSMSLTEFKKYFKKGDNTVQVKNSHKDTNAWMEIQYNVEIRKCPTK